MLLALIEQAGIGVIVAAPGQVDADHGRNFHRHQGCCRSDLPRHAVVFNCIQSRQQRVRDRARLNLRAGQSIQKRLLRRVARSLDQCV